MHGSEGYVQKILVPSLTKLEINDYNVSDHKDNLITHTFHDGLFSGALSSIDTYRNSYREGQEYVYWTKNWEIFNKNVT